MLGSEKGVGGQVNDLHKNRKCYASKMAHAIKWICCLIWPIALLAHPDLAICDECSV